MSTPVRFTGGNGAEGQAEYPEEGQAEYPEEVTEGQDTAVAGQGQGQDIAVGQGDSAEAGQAQGQDTNSAPLVIGIVRGNSALLTHIHRHTGSRQRRLYFGAGAQQQGTRSVDNGAKNAAEEQ